MSAIISKEEAESEIKKYLEIFKDATPFISKIPDATTLNYYNGDEISFIFEKTVIDAMWALNPTSNGLRVYYGSHDNGRPTLILIPCKIKKEDKVITGVCNLLASNKNAAAEWPDGRGRKNTELPSTEFDLEDDDI